MLKEDLPITKPIPIKNINNIEKNTYSLKNNFFDPTKNSPPNIFMIKLYNRVKYYDSSNINALNFENK